MVSTFKLPSLRQRRLPAIPSMDNTSLPMDGQDLESLLCEENLGTGFTIAGLMFMFFIVISSFFGNTLVCIASVKFSYLQTYSEKFICSLALSDILVAALVLPFDIIYWITFPRWPLGGVACSLWNSLFFLFLTASVLNLTAISIDRFLAVVYPLRYKAWMTPNLNKLMIACVWVYSVGIAILIFVLLKPPENGMYSFDLNPYFHGFLLTGNVVFPFLIMIILYTKIYIIARWHARRSGAVTSSPTHRSSSGSRKRFAQELKLAKTLGIVVLCFVICWLPFEIINIMILIDEGVINCAMEIADTVACWLAYLHSSMNPLLYAFASSEFRRAFKKLLFVNRQQAVSFKAGELGSRSRTAGRVGKRDNAQPDNCESKPKH